VSAAYPFLSLGYIVAAICAWFFFCRTHFTYAYLWNCVDLYWGDIHFAELKAREAAFSE